MKQDIPQNADKYMKKRRKKRRWLKVMSALGCIVVFWTVYALILPAITLEGPTYCGYEEHIHSDSCYQTNLICGQEQSEGHTHTEECYTTERELICGMEESEEHAHSEECYQENQVLICELEESEGHIHTTDCYEKVLICGKEEHQHNDECYSNRSADVETADVWEKTLENVELTGVWADDVLAVADSQMGYTESTYNYEVTDDGNHKGYTRYGAWYGDPYGDWCAMFVSFCLNYAAIPEDAFPYEANCDRWITALHEKENELSDGTVFYQEAGDYIPQPGDLIFFDWDEDGKSDHVGLVIEATESIGGWNVKTIEGNADNQVKNKTYSLTDEDILGFGILPENPNMPGEETEGEIEEKVTSDNEAEGNAESDAVNSTGISEVGEEDTADSNTDTEGNAAGISRTQVRMSNSLSYYSAEAEELAESNNGIMLADGESSGGDVSQSLNDNEDITSVTILYRESWNYDENGWKVITKDTELQENDQLRIELDYELPPHTLNPDDKTVEFDLPDAITIHNVSSGNVLDDNQNVIGTYSVTLDGKVLVTFNEDYEHKNDDDEEAIVGKVMVYLAVSDVNRNDSGETVLKFNDECVVSVDLRPTIENEQELKVEKSAGKFDQGTGLMTYTITVSSATGTYGEVTLQDVMQNVKIADVSGFSVKKGNEDITSQLTVPEDGSTSFDLTLPVMAQDGKYTITYSVQLTNPNTNGVVNAQNNVTVSSEDSSGHKIHDTAEITTEIDHTTLTKTGQFNDDGTITWTIIVNQRGANLNGWTLSDLFNGKEITVTDIVGDVSITPMVDGKSTIKLPYTFTTDTFEKYTITYKTSAEKVVGATETTNQAKLTKDGITYDTGSVGGGNNADGRFEPLKKTANDPLVESADGKTATGSWTITIDADQGDIPAEWRLIDELWSGQYLTGKQLKEMISALNVSMISSNLNLNYTITAWKQSDSSQTSWGAPDGIGDRVENLQDESILNGIADTDRFKQYEIIFTTTLNKGKSFSFTYETTAPIEGLTDTTSFTNSARIGNVYSQPSLSYKPTKPTIQKWDNNSGNHNASTSHAYSENDGEMEWRILINMPENYTGGDLTVVEQLPEGVELIKLRTYTYGGTYNSDPGVVLYDTNDETCAKFPNSHSFTVNGVAYSMTFSRDEENPSRITINIPEKLLIGGVKEVNFFFTVKIPDSYEWIGSSDGEEETGTFQNTATLKGSEQQELGAATQTQTITKYINEDLIEKGGVQEDGTNRVKYHLVVNPDGENLLDGSETLTLRDTMTYKYYRPNEVLEASLVQDSVKVYLINADGTKTLLDQTACPYLYAESGDEDAAGNGSGTRTLTFTIPNRTPLYIEYSYLLKGGNTNWTYEISNTATLDGVTVGGGGNDTKTGVRIVESKAFATVDGMYLCKVDKDNNAIALQGAKFRLAKWDDASTDYVLVKWDELTKTYVELTDEEIAGGTVGLFETGSDGKFHLSHLDYNTAYCLTEVTPPEGYKINTEPYYFYIHDSDTEKNPEHMPTTHSYIIERLSGGRTVYFSDESEYTSISVRKIWQDNEGNSVSPSVDSVSFKLMRKPVSMQTVNNAKVSVSIYNWSKDDWGNEIFSVSETSKPASTVVTFTITQLYKDGKINPTITCNGIVQIPETKSTQYTNLYGNQDTKTEYTYSITLSAGINVISGYVGTWTSSDYKISEVTYVVPAQDDTLSTPVNSEVETFSISSNNGWVKTISNLPKTGSAKDAAGNVIMKDGKEVEYTYEYYVEEIGTSDWYTASYTNNGGIQSGIISITNTITGEPEPGYELPATGGSGLILYTAGGILFMLCAAFLLMYRYKKCGKEGIASS